MKPKFWSLYTETIQVGAPLIKSEFVKKGKARFLLANDTQIFLFKVYSF